MEIHSPPHSRLSRNSSSRPLRPPFRAARAFYLTLLIGATFAAFAILTTHPSTQSQPNALLSKRGVSAQLNEEEQCRLVHRAKDQCAFVKSQCPNEEAGFAAYLDLYYCQLPHVKAIGFIILISWLGLLFSTIGIAASDFFCINLSTIATILGMSESMAGVTFLAFGNGSPDVFSTFAAMSTNSGSLAVGELFGAAGFITAVVSGSMALIRPFHVARKSFVRDVGFFIVAAAFSIVFLYDGKLHFWECISMVIFYVFYVAFVVVWHWWLGRRRRRREKEAAARGHFIPHGDELETEEEEPYRDDPDEAPPRRPSIISRGVSREDWSALERGGGMQQDDGDEDEEEEERERWMSELSSNMRLTRPPRSRKNTVTPVRPSLVGALEFQAVLKSLQKSRNIQTYPMDSRRYSDDPTFTSAQQQNLMSSTSDPASRPPYTVDVEDDSSPTLKKPRLNIPQTAPARSRALSMGAALDVRIDPDLERTRSPSPMREGDPDLIEFGERDAQAQSHHTNNSLEPIMSGQELRPTSPSVTFSPAPVEHQGPPDDTGFARAASALKRSEHLAPPHGSMHSWQKNESLSSVQRREMDSPHDSPRTVPHASQLPKIIIPGRERSRSRGSTPSSSPYPRYRDNASPAGSRPPSIYLPPPTMPSPESLPEQQSEGHTQHARPGVLDRWWPYNALPPPGLVISTLFPTIYHWHEKNYWEKALGVVAAPSVFLLTITLPVVESGKDGEEEDNRVVGESLDSARSKSVGAGVKGPVGTSMEVHEADQRPVGSHRHGSWTTAGAGAAAVATSTEQHHRHNRGDSLIHQPPTIAVDQDNIASSPINEHLADPPPLELWNRWLLIVQLYLAPLFIVLAIYSQSPIDISPKWLIKPTLISLLVSTILLIPLLLTTTPSHKPQIYRYILSLVGFIVSIAWISTIAGQVVGALKALAVILNMSHAIMGLTIFAVGNSLGDLVADVTVAKLGYPVMALSACFGGPMLNILLGIGLSGSYILMRGAQKRVHKHPDKDFKFHTYHIEVSNTLIVSGATLLVTLVGLLIVVPMNRWVLSKKIGWALIVLWIVSTVGNVVLEVTGFTGGKQEDMMMRF